MNCCLNILEKTMTQKHHEINCVSYKRTENLSSNLRLLDYICSSCNKVINFHSVFDLCCQEKFLAYQVHCELILAYAVDPK